MDDVEGMRCLERLLASGVDLRLGKEGHLFTAEVKGYGTGIVQIQKSGRLADAVYDLYESVIEYAEKQKSEYGQ